jgi:hypothetical protein
VVGFAWVSIPIIGDIAIIPKKSSTMAADELKKQTHLKPQDAATVEPAKLTALTPEVVRFLVWNKSDQSLAKWLLVSSSRSSSISVSFIDFSSSHHQYWYHWPRRTRKIDSG